MATAGAPRQLSLRWKLFLVLSALLGLIPIFLGYLGYRNLVSLSDQTAASAGIASDIGGFEAVAAFGLAVSGAAMFLLLTPPLRRLRAVTEAPRWIPKAPARAAATVIAAAAADPESPVDLSVLRAVFGEGESQVSSVLADFIRINAPLMQELEEATRKSALDRVKALAHKIGGSAAFAGALPFSKALSDVERQAQDGAHDRVPALVARASAAFDEIRAWAERRAAT